MSKETFEFNDTFKKALSENDFNKARKDYLDSLTKNRFNIDSSDETV